MSSFFRGESVTIRRVNYTGFKPDGTPIEDTVDIPVKDVLVSFQNTSTLKTVAERAIETQVALFFTPSVIVRDDDLYVIRGTLWEQDGVPIKYDDSIFKGNTGFLVNKRIKVNVKQYQGKVQ